MKMCITNLFIVLSDANKKDIPRLFVYLAYSIFCTTVNNYY